MKKVFLMLVVAALCCSGCAMTVEKVSLNYKPPVPAIQGAALAAKLDVAQVQDNRGHENPCLLYNKINGHGNTAIGGYAAEKPLANIVTDALKDYFAAYPAKSGAGSHYELAGTIEDSGYTVTSGWFSNGLITELTMKFYLKDLNDKSIVWNDTFTGKGNLEKWSGFNGGIEESFRLALDNLMEKLSSSEPFKNKILM